MSSQKTTVNLEKDLLAELDTIADALEQTRNKIIIEALTQYVKANLETAKVIAEKKQELAKLMQEVK